MSTSITLLPGSFPESIISQIMKKAPPRTVLQLGTLSRNFHCLLLKNRGIPIATASFTNGSKNLTVCEIDDRLELECGIDYLDDPDCIKAFGNINLSKCILNLENATAEKIHKLATSTRIITPRQLIIKASSLFLDDFYLLTRRHLKALHFVGECHPPPEMEYLLEKTKSADYILISINNMIIKDNIRDLLFTWQRPKPFRACKFNHLPASFTPQNGIEFAELHGNSGNEICFFYEDTVKSGFLKSYFHHFQQATVDLPANILFYTVDNDQPCFTKCRMNVFQSFFQMSAAELDQPNTRFGFGILML